MTTTALVLLAAAAVVAVLDWIAVMREWRPLEAVAKPLTMVMLIAAAACLDPRSSGQRGWFLVALGFSLLGDVLLMLPERFVLGLGSFLVAHVAFVVGFVVAGNLDPTAFVVAVVVLGVVDVALLRRIVTAMRRDVDAAGLVTPVIGYAAVISLMTAVAVAHGVWLAVVGAGLFMVSDLAIVWSRFVRPFASARVFIMVTYHLAQFALVVSLVL